MLLVLVDQKIMPEPGTERKNEKIYPVLHFFFDSRDTVCDTTQRLRNKPTQENDMTAIALKTSAATSNDSYYADFRAMVSNGKFFSVTFVKKDGTVRKMLCRTGVGLNLADHTKGEADILAGVISPEAKKVMAVRKRAANNPHLLNVWDVQKKAWRSVNMDTVLSVRANGFNFEF